MIKFADNSSGVSDIQGIVVNPMATNPNALMKMYGKSRVTAKDLKITQMDPNTVLDLVKFGFTIPQTINGRAVEWIRLERIYILFEDNDQIFQPINNTVVVKR